MLVFLGIWGLLGLIIAAIIVGMFIIGLFYSFIKQVRLYFNMLGELKKNAPHPLDSQQRGGRKQKAKLETTVPAFRLKESLLLWPRELKIICCLSLIIALLEAAFFTANMAGWKSDVSFFIALLLNFLSAFFVFFAPIVGLFCIKLTGKLKKTIQQLEEGTVRQETFCMQDARGGKHDE
ncbi:hypothetical protein [Bartonella machadoae]|uniref:hypothetical protein n=1 Tax=Bartonella machadoae TaxID=2893471 RepID=UPI001F4D143D|nr:hypothetical protein [Bartonella machadoae]UNE53942.1 hypothetical protein LNM86_10215 [Bartonella machadoae]